MKRKVRSEKNGAKSRADHKGLMKVYRELSPYLNIGYTLVFAILLFTYIGQYLDQRWEVTPWMSLAGALCGITVGFYHLFKVALKPSKKNPENEIQ